MDHDDLKPKLFELVVNRLKYRIRGSLPMGNADGFIVIISLVCFGRTHVFALMVMS